ncbi:phage tail protein [Oculatella sp. LEGE 06141]|uniref:phage tail protein n=1 Tax=Oculatella sp. LEGE 06141 TaxID=1828648 RepID=UPI001880A15C|nr:phage tail protein [Oculatella sp. LEGE 06141]MBE9183038.1 phage tail protein [Oculatella sp. LEGE 06141]
MVHALPLALKLDLTPMRIAEVAPQDELTPVLAPGIATETISGGRSLVVYPGEPSEMLVQVKNLRTHSVALSLKVEGNFPAEWCQLGTEGRELPAHGQMDAVLYFQLPATFFEEQRSLHPQGNGHLRLKYHVLVTAQASDRDSTQIQQAEFDLYIRPRSLYLDFLPDLYREVDFIGRFLTIFEQAFEPVVQSFDAMWANLDPLTAPADLLPFLAHWVGWPLEPEWNPMQQRRLVRQAVELYRWRGTRKGLRLYLHWYTGLPLDDDSVPELKKQISITEPFGAGFVLGEAVLDEGAVLGGGQAYHFCVRLRVDRPNSTDRIDEPLIRKIIEQEKPAFCTYELLIEVAD